MPFHPPPVLPDFLVPLLPGFRCVAPDLLGLGFSDRLPRMSDHSVERLAAAIGDVSRSLYTRQGSPSV